MSKTADHRPPDRRRFLTAAAGVTLTAQSYASIVGSNQNLTIGLIGCGARAQAHVHILKSIPNVRIGMVCDVWDGLRDEYIHEFGGQTTKRSYAQGLHPTAEKVGLNPHDVRSVVTDFRRVLEAKSIDAVCIATPDHWHAKMTIDALAAGKHVFVERPIAHTPHQAKAVLAAANDSRLTVSVGVQSLSDPGIAAARDLVRKGEIGPAVHLTGGAFKNDARGQWRFYRVVSEMNRRTIDWDLFLGHGFDVAGEPVGPSVSQKRFSPETFTQWRCESEFSGGPVSELLSPVITRLLAVSGIRQVTRSLMLGTTHHETDGRTIPDCVTIAADFAEGCHLSATATTLSNYPVEDVIRGRSGTLKLVKGGVQIFRDDANRGTTFPPRWERQPPPAETVLRSPPKNETDALWRDFLACIGTSSQATICTPELACAAVVACSPHP